MPLGQKIRINRLRKLCLEERPDVACFHNFFPIISPSAYAGCKDAGVAVIQKLNNYRLICPSATMFRNGKACEVCLKSNPCWSAFYRCYRHSFLQTLAVARMINSNWERKTWAQLVDIFITETYFVKKKHVERGLPAGKIVAEPVFLPNPPRPSYKDSDYAVFIGRLSPEKGVLTLLKAWRDIPLVLKIVGDGPLKCYIEKEIKDKQLKNIDFLGFGPRQECLTILCKARFSIVPSEWYEPFGRVVMEAFACAKPVIASRFGGLEEVVGGGFTGLLFEPHNAENLKEKVVTMLEQKDKTLQMGRNARKIFERNRVRRSTITPL